MTQMTTLAAFIDAQHAQQIDFLRELVKVPSDNPAGDCAPHAARAQILLEQLGLPVEAYPVPDALVKAHGMISATNLIVRKKVGAGGPAIALNAQVGEPEHWRAVLAADEVPMQLNPSLHVVGFRKLKAAEAWVASEKDFQGWHYTIEPLYAAPQADKQEAPAQPVASTSQRHAPTSVTPLVRRSTIGTRPLHSVTA